MIHKNDPPKFDLSFIDAVVVLKKYGLFLNASNEFSTLRASNIVADTRKLKSGSAYVAYSGVSQDLHDFIPTAIKGGCSFVVGTRPLASLREAAKTPYIQVSNGRAAWAVLAAEGWKIPQLSLKYIGITGTNGKTSVCHITCEILRVVGHSCLGVGTLGYKIGETYLPSVHTTPDPDEFYKTIAEAHAQHHIQTVVMEVSSHALAQKKLLPIKFDACVFTSFSRDHLDFHASMEEYLNTKLELFGSYAKQDARFIVHQDLIHHLPKAGHDDHWSFGFQKEPHWSSHWHLQYQGGSATHSLLALPNAKSRSDIPYVGQTGALNFAAGWLAAETVVPRLNMNEEKLAALRGIPGRLEAVSLKTNQDIQVIVDYCHTPDALEQCLVSLRSDAHAKNGDLWVVFGCGGNRDKGKRPIMGKIAFDNADCVVVTSDNPRSEDPKQILAEICQGMDRSASKLIVEEDRRKAIFTAIKQAKPGSIIVVAGKGHETYQIIGADRFPFDDRIVSKEALQQRT